jgi:hypothetical protein
MFRMPLRTVGAGLAIALSMLPFTIAAQKPDYLAEVAPVVRGLPFSADGNVVMRLTLFDGTRIEQQMPAKYYRDSMGRVRREQSIVGLSALNPVTDTQFMVTIVDPVAGYLYTIVGNKAEVQRTPFDRKPKWIKLNEMNPAVAAAVPPGLATREEDLGRKEIDGLMAAGRKITTIIPKGFLGNDRPMEVTDERWESVDLRVLILSRHHDPRSGDVEYRLTNIKRAEPPKDLFLIPAGYRVIDLGGRLSHDYQP